jgi:hypothetical protein
MNISIILRVLTFQCLALSLNSGWCQVKKVGDLHQLCIGQFTRWCCPWNKQTIRKLIETITSAVHVSSFDETHSSTGSKGNTLYQLAASNPCVHWAATTKLRLCQTVYHFELHNPFEFAKDPRASKLFQGRQLKFYNRQVKT